MKKVQDLLTDAGKFPPWETSIYIKLQKGRLDPSSISDVLKSLHNAAKKGDLVVQDRPFLQQQNPISTNKDPNLANHLSHKKIEY